MMYKCACILRIIWEAFQNANLFPSFLTFIQGNRAVKGWWYYEDVVLGGSLMAEEQSEKM